MEEARCWAASRAWYQQREIPWRRGWLLYGPPGTGKSAFTRAIGQDLNLPIYHFDLGSMDNREFMAAWNDALTNTPAIVLIEDIDGVFNGRKNVAVEEGGLDFSTLLNAISGVQKSDGIFTIVTTNKIETVDEALGVIAPDGMSSRPGRLDRVILMPVLSKAGRDKMAARILANEPQEVRDRLVAEGESDTGAKFQERCSRYALVSYWETKSGSQAKRA